MEATNIQLYRSNTKNIRVLKTFAYIFEIFGFTGVTVHFLFSGYSILDISVWGFFIFIFQGANTWYLLSLAEKRNRFFISWNKDEISYFFPKSKQAEKIRIEEIQSIKNNDKQIIISLKNQTEKRINLNFIFHPKRDRVAEYFINLKDNLERRDTQSSIRHLRDNIIVIDGLLVAITIDPTGTVKETPQYM